MTATDTALDADWLGLCRRAVEGAAEVLAATPSTVERARETGTRGSGGDRTLVIDSSAEAVVFAELQALYDQGYRFSAISEERGEVDFGGGGVRVIIDPIDGSLNAKRDACHYALSVAVADGPTMADVAFGFVHDFGAREQWWARRGEGAWRDGVRLDPDTRASAAPATAAWSCWGSSPPIRAGCGAAIEPLTAATRRLRALGTIASTLCQVAAARFDAMVTLRRCRGVDAAAGQLIVREAGGLHQLCRLRRPARRAAGRHPQLPPGRRPHRGHAARAGGGPRPAMTVIDWILAEKIAGYLAGTGDAADARADLAALAIESERRVTAYTGLEPARPLPPPEGIGRREWVQTNIKAMRSLLDPVLDRAGEGLGPLKPAAKLALGVVVTTEVGVVLGYLAQRVLGQYELVLLDERRDRDPAAAAVRACPTWARRCAPSAPRRTSS